MDERLAYLEGKVDEQSRGVGELRDAIRHLDQKVDARFGALDQKVDARFGALDQKIDVRADALSARIDALDQKVDRFREELSGRIGALDQKIDAHALALDQKITRYFGLMIGLEAGLLTALFSAFWAYVAR